MNKTSWIFHVTLNINFVHMKKYIVGGVLVLLISFINIQAQNIRQEDMLRSSQYYPWGTARTIGMGSAFGALGGDMTSLSLNPAGIGMYRSSEFTFTPSVSYNNSVSTLPDSVSTTNRAYTNDDFAMRLNIQNIGYVYTYNTHKDEGWVSVSYGIAYNRLNDFNRNVLIKTPHANSSLLDEFVYYANDQGNGPIAAESLYSYYEGLAYQTYALDNVLYADGWWHSDYSYDHQYGESQIRKREIRGGIGEYAFSIGANYSHKLYLGLTLGIQSLKYKETTTHTETDVDGTVYNLESFDFSTYFDMHGVGYNFKLGLVYRPIDFLRLGFAVHSPTFYDIESEFYTTMYSSFDGLIVDGEYPDDYKETVSRINDNTLFTPWKFVGSAALQIEQYGLLSVDYEWLDYSNMKLRGDIDSYNDPNDYLDDSYKGVHNIRIGGEGKIGPFALRAGIGLYSTPYKSGDLDFIDYTSYSAGMGYRNSNFFLDFAYVFLKYSERYTLYDYIERGGTTDQTWAYNPTMADTDSKFNKFIVTMGFKF